MAKTPRAFVIGTAGHIDHGKTSLVAALTGHDTDRLPEEKARGITIALGFAPWHLPGGLETSIVDVPGHEGFVRTMVAGAGGIDIMLLVVSAEDGVMPQTREHIGVCELLGVEHGVVALTKIDRLDEPDEGIALASEDVRAALASTRFAEAVIVPCSAKTGAGLSEIGATVARLVPRLERRASRGDPILPLDRVFTIKGHGTVVTGTLLRGTIDADEDASFVLVGRGDRPPARVRARGAQVRGQGEPRIVAGSRTALNLAAIDLADVRRGDVLTRGPAVATSEAVHAWLRHLPTPGGSAPDRSPWTSGTSVEVCIGTAHAVGRLDPLSDACGRATGSIAAGSQGVVRIRLDPPLPVWHGARLVVRAFHDPCQAAAGRTIGGGTILDPAPSPGRGQRPRWLALGRALRSGDPTERLLALVHDAAGEGITTAELAHRAGVDPASDVDARLAASERAMATSAGRWMDAESIPNLVQTAIAHTDRFHAQHPMVVGINRAELESALGPRIAPDVAATAIASALGRGALRTTDDPSVLARPGKGLSADGRLPRQLSTILGLYREGGTSPPTLKEVGARANLEVREVVRLVGALQRTGDLVKVTPDLSFDKDSHQRLVDQVRAHLRTEGRVDVQDLKRMTGLSRKFVVPFLEHLDSLQITLRRGDARRPGPRA